MLGGVYLCEENHQVEKRGVPSLCICLLESHKFWHEFGD